MNDGTSLFYITDHASVENFTGLEKGLVAAFNWAAIVLVGIVRLHRVLIP